MKLKQILRRKVRRVIQMEQFTQQDIVLRAPIMLPGLVDDYAQRMAIEAQQAADARTVLEKINLHPDLLNKKHNNITAHNVGWYNFLKSYFQRFNDICELCKFFIKSYNTFYLQRVYLY